VYEEEEVKRVSPKCFFRVVRGKDSRIGGSRMCAFFNFQGGFCNFPISISPRPSNAKRTNFARVCKAKKKIDRADLLATTHREINSFFVERKYKTYPAISRLLPMRMQRNSSSFGRRDDETEDRKEIYLSILFFSNFSPLVLEKLYTRHHHA
jgi:hypothetical protein